MTRVLIAALLIMTGCSDSTSPEDADLAGGVWKGSVPQGSVRLVLQQDGSFIDGWGLLPETPLKVIGNRDDAQVEFTVLRDFNGQFIADFSGRLTEQNTMTGTWNGTAVTLSR